MYRMDDGIGIEGMQDELARWECMFDSELSVLRNWEYISSSNYILIWNDKREYFNELKEKMTHQPG